jgi:hypothetical protein
MEAMKRASLETMVTNAKAAGMFNEEEAKNWRGTARREVAEETVEAVSEEGEVVAAAPAVPLQPAEAAPASAQGEQGPLAQWINKGMPVSEPLEKLGLKGMTVEKSSPMTKPVPAITIHTIELPARAPKELMLDVKSIFQMFPGSEKVQLKIGTQIVPVNLTVTMSPIFEKRIEEAVKKYSGAA